MQHFIALLLTLLIHFGFKIVASIFGCDKSTTRERRRSTTTPRGRATSAYWRDRLRQSRRTILTRHRRAFRDEISKIARRLGGTIQESGSQSTIRFHRKGQPYSVQIEAGTGSAIRVTCPWPDTQFRFRLFSDRHVSFSRKTFAEMMDLEIGQTAFDREFVLQSDSPEKMRRLLAPSVTSRILAHQRFGNRRISIHIFRGQVELGGMALPTMRVEQTVALIASLAEIHRVMLLQSDTALITSMRRMDNLRATCPVCATELADPSRQLDEVRCARCDVAYHHECWEYAGKCAIYGCRSRKYLRR